MKILDKEETKFETDIRDSDSGKSTVLAELDRCCRFITLLSATAPYTSGIKKNRSAVG